MVSLVIFFDDKVVFIRFILFDDEFIVVKVLGFNNSFIICLVFVLVRVVGLFRFKSRMFRVVWGCKSFYG